MTWTLLLALTIAHTCLGNTIETKQIDSKELLEALKSKTISLVIFGDRKEQENSFKKQQVDLALSLLKKEKDSITVFETSLGDDEELKKQYMITQEPEFRIFWRGIMMPLPKDQNFSGVKIFRWVRMHIRLSKYTKTESVDTETFFTELKEQNPYIVIGLGDKKSPEANFLNEFSKIPISPFKIYFLEEKRARKVFQSVGLSGSKFNLLLINNVGKKITEFMDDVDFFNFYKFLETNAKSSGIFGFGSKVKYITDTIMLREKVMVLFPPASMIKQDKDQDFLEGMRRMARMFKLSIFWGEYNSDYNDMVDYVDCKESDKICGYIYENFHQKADRTRFKVELSSMAEDTMEDEISSILKKGTPYFFSSDATLSNLSRNSKIKALSRNNLSDSVNGNKDSLILIYSICGSNCQEKVKYLKEFIGLLSDKSLKALNIYICDTRKNEMPSEFYNQQALSFLFVRKTAPEELISLKNIRSNFDLLKNVKKLATSEIVTTEDEDDDFEDYI